MKYYAVLDAISVPIAFYNDDVYPPTLTPGDGPSAASTSTPNTAIPSTAIAITEAQWHECIANNGLRQLINGALVAYTPPVLPPTIPETITEHQFIKQLVIEGDITPDEAIAFLSSGVIPSIFANAIAQLPAASQPMARIDFVGAKSFDRHNPLTEGLGALIGKTPAQLDALWTAAAALS
jgi:hypothetical protein